MALQIGILINDDSGFSDTDMKKFTSRATYSRSAASNMKVRDIVRREFDDYDEEDVEPELDFDW